MRGTNVTKQFLKENEIDIVGAVFYAVLIVLETIRHKLAENAWS
ncbi:hypothetical protein [Peptostreptococcus equinus]|uniref:Uncharacterized protein n=1 Tax=Peptostreptococcus equinus TaxID=3003601 RepID=A0ABY7JPF6_9FIRM|nr:hypothetical protein [Peptostreptococcus sp. CBA3647]WAW15249.1 hypothetical protein O0R46_02020 [Peptostreptococcus sp. CBA3647]